ncbi:MAG: alpha/beta fold hydrolase [Phenylobacterium sp.]|uniref:alpha/beta fold hydrolase n=1 Tax=Phenylobacterium sp. TaxID=1871053 RepID=UPI00391C331B
MDALPSALRRLAACRGLPVGRAAPASRTFETSDGVRLHFLDWAGEGETLVLLHGGLLSAHTFDLFCLAIGAAHRCLAVDLRGHGQSGWAEDYSVPRMAADVAELVEALRLRDLHLLGMSLGGCVAGHAAKLIVDRLGSLTFVDVGPDVNFGSTARMRSFLESVRPAPTIQAVVEEALIVSPGSDPDLVTYRYSHLLRRTPEGYFWKADRRRPTDFPHILAKLAELQDLAKDVRCPTLVVQGGRSRVLTEPAAKQFAATFPNGAHRLIPAAGHNVQEDAPAELALLTLELMQTTLSRRTSAAEVPERP